MELIAIGLPSNSLARWATADYDKIIIRNTHFVGPPIHSASSIGFFLCQIRPLTSVFLLSRTR